MFDWMATGVVIGIVCETAAYLQGLWVYRRPVFRITNVVVVFGVVMGTLASRAARWGIWPVFGAGVAIGLGYEVLNLAVLHWWRFPDERVGPLRGQAVIVTGLAISWGAVPVVAALVRGAF
jgi:hypothetical protein